VVMVMVVGEWVNERVHTCIAHNWAGFA